MNKRGVEINQELLFVIFELILVLSVGFLMIQYTVRSGRDATFEKKDIAKDLSLLTQTIASSPGNVFYIYGRNLNLSNYDYLFDSNIQILEGDHAPIIYVTPKNKFIEYELIELFSPITISFQKLGQIFKLQQRLELNKYSNCPAFYPSINSNTIILDPGQDPQNPGNQNLELNLKENEITWAIADSIFLEEFEIVKTKTEASVATTKERKEVIESTENLFAISMHLIDEEIINIYYNSESSNKNISSYLSCLIVNELQKEFEINARIIPVDPSVLYEFDQKKILFSDSPIVYLELGDISATEDNIFTEHSKISNTIKNAIQKYT